jgi:hypothetical protein
MDKAAILAEVLRRNALRREAKLPEIDIDFGSASPARRRSTTSMCASAIGRSTPRRASGAGRG